jgi:hypothetical protein
MKLLISDVKWKPDIAMLVTVVVVWGLLYLPFLRTSPSWYGDEGLALTAGLNLMRGIPAHGSFWNTFWNPYAPYQPAYEILIGIGAKLAGGDILGGRLVNTVFALGIGLTLCFGGRRVMTPLAAFGASLIFLGYEQSVIHFRWIFTHNLVALGFAIAFLWLCGKPTIRRDWMAGMGLSLGALALPLGIYGCVAAFLVRIRHPRSWFRVLGPYAIATAASLAVGWLLFREKDLLWSDLSAMAEFYSDASRENGGGLKIFQNFYRFFTQDPFHLAGLVMVLVCLAGRARALAVATLAVTLLLLQNRQNLTVFYYQAVILLPLIGACYGAGFETLAEFLKRRRDIRPCIPQFLKLAPALIGTVFCLCMLPHSLSGTLKTRIDYWCTQSIPEVEAAAEWLNKRTTPEDFVLCHQNIAWLLHARTGDYLQATTWLGYPTWPFKKPLRKDQFRFAPDISTARFAVIADIDRRWTFAQPNVEKTIRIFESEKWPVVWAGENYLVLENPRYSERK